MNAERKVPHNILDWEAEINFHKSEQTGRVLILAYFYYEQSFETYADRLFRYAERYTVLLMTASDVLYREIKERAAELGSQNLLVSCKENRGRDVSALLVAARETILSYDFLAFFHDKASKTPETRGFVQDWEAELFENTLGSIEYVENVLNLLESRTDVGLLLPPEPIGEYWYADSWLGNYENTVRLASKLGLNIEIDRETPPRSLGTVFWCRVNAFRRLFEYPWEYQDFPEEPLAGDGTISHAIERILPFVAESAGYRTEIVMTRDYAEKLLLDKSAKTVYAMRLLDQYMGIVRFDQLKDYAKKEKELRSLRGQSRNLYIYGAGINGKACAKTLKCLGIVFDGFVVTEKSREPGDSIDELPVLSLDETVEDGTGYILAVGPLTRKTLEQELRKRGCEAWVTF